MIKKKFCTLLLLFLYASLFPVHEQTHAIITENAQSWCQEYAASLSAQDKQIMLNILLASMEIGRIDMLIGSLKAESLEKLLRYTTSAVDSPEREQSIEQLATIVTLMKRLHGAQCYALKTWRVVNDLYPQFTFAALEAYERIGQETISAAAKQEMAQEPSFDALLIALHDATHKMAKQSQLTTNFYAGLIEEELPYHSIERLETTNSLIEEINASFASLACAHTPVQKRFAHLLDSATEFCGACYRELRALMKYEKLDDHYFLRIFSPDGIIPEYERTRFMP